MSNDLKELGFVGLIIGIATGCYSVYQNYKNKQTLKETTDKLNMSIDEVSRSTKVDIEQRLIDKAVERAVEREVHRATVETVSAIKTDIHDTISKNVKKEVDSQFKLLSEEVSEKISEQVAAISDEALVNKVIPKVEAKLMKKGEDSIYRAVSEVRDQANRQFSGMINTYDGLSSVIGKFISNSNNGGGNDGRTLQFKL